MKYKEQLESQEWQLKRREILERDNYCCKKCNTKRSPFLNLSQKFGIKSYKEMINIGYKVEINNNEIIININNFSEKANFIEENNKNIVKEKLFFAKRYVEPKNKFIFKFNSYELICFYSKIETKNRVTDLNIHHKYYIEKRLAWEYDNDALITLCEKCHQKEHEEIEIKVLNEEGQLLYIPEICDKCSGSGYIHEFEYYQNGICFKCGGHGVIFP